MTTCVLIRNPAARGAMNDVTLAHVLEAARAGGWRVECAVSEYPQHPTQLARQAAREVFEQRVTEFDTSIEEGRE